MKDSLPIILASILLFVMGSTPSIWADVSSATGLLTFDSDGDSNDEMTLSSNGLIIGTGTASSNLQVTGNVIITKSLIIGGSTNDSGSNLHVHGSLSYGFSSYGSGSNQVSQSSMVFVDTSSGNATLLLPDLSSTVGQQLTIKRTSDLNSLTIAGSGNSVDNFTTLFFPSGNYSSLSLLNNGSAWFVMGMNESESLGEVGSDNLFLWWKLDESSGNTATDSSATANRSGNLLNNHHFSGNSATGPVGNGVLLDEANDYISYENGGLSSSAYSYCFWVNNSVSSSSNVDVECLIEGKAGFIWASSNTNFHLSAYHQLDGGGNYSTTGLPSALQANTWYHLGVTWDGSDLALYENGVWQSSNTATTWVPGANVILAHPGSSGNVFSVGQVKFDDVRVFDRALDANEMDGLYKAGNH
jgi:hypothetical protein